LLKEHVKVVNLLGRENKKQVIPPVDVRLPSPPPVPQWTSELVWSHVKQRVKQQLLAVRGQVYRFGVKPSLPPPDLTRCERILVPRTDRLGDAVLTFPLIQALKLLAPLAELTYAVRTPWVNLFRGQKGVDRVIALPEEYSQQTQLLASIHPDLIIDPQIDPAMKTARLCQKSQARWRIGFSGYGRERHFTTYRTPPGKDRHFSQGVLDLLELWAHAAREPVIPPFLEIPPSARSWWRTRLEEIPDLSAGYVCIHPGGFYPTQRWPLGRFYQLADRIQKELGRKVVWCWDESSKAGDSFRSPPFTDDRNIISFSDLTIDQLAAVVGNAQLFIGNSSGPLHLACALATPTISLMGPTPPDRWWPIGENHRVLRLGVACSPCSLGLCSHHTCLRALDVDLVFKVVRDESLL